MFLIRLDRTYSIHEYSENFTIILIIPFSLHLDSCCYFDTFDTFMFVFVMFARLGILTFWHADCAVREESKCKFTTQIIIKWQRGF